MSVRLVITTLPDKSSAVNLANHIVAGKLAACVNLVEGITSVYEWDGKLDQASEVLLLAKTAAARVPALKAAILEQHPYDLPELIVLDVSDGSPAYLDWVMRQSSRV